MNYKRGEPLRAWEENLRPEAEKGKRPYALIPAKFKDIKDKYTARLSGYIISK